MGLYRFTGPDGRDYFPAHIGHVDPGDEREFRVPPDRWWALVRPAAPSAPPQSNPGATDQPDAPEPVEEG